MSKEQEKEDLGNFFKAYYSILKIKAGKNFNLTDKMVLLVILSLNDSKKHCFAKNKYISEILGLSEVTISTSIGRLCENLGLVTREGNRQTRVLIPISSKELIKRLDGVSRKAIKELNEVHQGTIPTSSKSLMNSSKSLDIINKNNINNKINVLDKKDLLSDKESDGISPDSNNNKSSPSKNITEGEKIYDSKSPPYLLSWHLFNLVLTNYPNFDNNRLQNPSYKERKLQNGASSIDLMIRIDKRPIDEIIEVIEWASQDSFWKQNIKSGSKLRKQYDELLIRIEAESSKTLSQKQEEKLLVSPNSELTNLIIEFYGLYKKGDSQYKPLSNDYPKFVEATKLMILFHEEDNYPSKKEQVKNLFQMLRSQYGDKGNGITPAYICSANTWYELMPEFYALHLGVGHSWVKNGANRVKEYFDKKHGN